MGLGRVRSFRQAVIDLKLYFALYTVFRLVVHFLAL